MKTTKTMLLGLLVFFITWLLIGTMIYLLSDLNYKHSLTSNGLTIFMFIFGWLPAVIVAADYDENYE